MVLGWAKSGVGVERGTAEDWWWSGVGWRVACGAVPPYSRAVNSVSGAVMEARLTCSISRR